MPNQVSFDVVAFDKASQALLKVAERFDKLIDRAEALDRKRVNVRVDADTSRADGALDKTKRKADELDRKRVNLKVEVGDFQAKLALITAGVAAVGHLGPAAVAGLAAVPAVLGMAAQGAAVLAIGLHGVGDGVKALSQAEAGLAQGGAAAQAAQAQLEQKLNQLSPSARSLAESLHGQVLPALHGIRDGVQSTLLPRLEVSLENLVKLSPQVTTGLSGTGKVLGDLAVRGSAMMTTGPWRADFATIMASNNRSLNSFGTAGLYALDSVRSLTVAALPLVERFAQATQRGAELANTFIQNKRASGELGQFMTAAGDTLATFGHTALQVAEAAAKLSLTLGPMGGILLKIVGGLAELIGNLAAANPTLTQFAAAGFLAYTVYGKLSPVINAVGNAYGKVSKVVKTASDALTVGNVAAQGAAEGLGGAATSAEQAATSGGRFSTTLGKIGGSLPIIGLALAGVALAYDNARSSADQASSAIERGGADAVKAVRDLQAADADAQSHSFGNWIGALSNALGLAQPSLESTKTSLDAVGQAHLAAAQATIKHEDAVKRYGPDSAEAKTAADALTVAVDGEQMAQRAAADATRDHTQELLAQQNTMLAAVDKNLAYRQSQLGVEQAQKALTDAVKQHGVASLEARDAGLQYESSLYREITALGDNVRAQNSAQTAAEQDRLAIQAQKDEIFRLVAAAGSSAPPALRQMAAGMSDADFTARGATIRVDELGRRVVSLPGGKTITIDANTDPASAALRAFINSYQGRQIVLRVSADTGAIPRAAGGIDVPAYARGGVAMMAAGGALKATAMRSVATIVPPNTPRLIGDRMRDNESFIPWDGSSRSEAILEQTARAMGYALAPLTGSSVGGNGSGGPIRAIAPVRAGGASAGRQQISLQLHSGGSRLDDLLVELLRKAIKNQGGGDVQGFLGA